jgi:exodeoxyribonuclease V alpha subunit
MNEKELTLIYKNGIISDIDLHFARLMTRLAPAADTAVGVAAALVSRATGEGAVCLDLQALGGRSLPMGDAGERPVVCPAPAVWRRMLMSSGVVGGPGEFRPLVLDADNRLYLYRYWEYEQTLAAALAAKASAVIADIDPVRMQASLQRLFPNPLETPVDWQRVAAAVAALKTLCIISGGPGSGKTTTVARLLALLLEQGPTPSLRIQLAAPTGKAAARISASIRAARRELDCEAIVKDAIPAQATTLHRLLGAIPGSPYFRHNAQNPLAVDVVVVDEASMVDLALMAKLVQAMPPAARLVLVGDKDQLASVEAGAVLGDICGGETRHRFSREFCPILSAATGENLHRWCDPAQQRSGLSDCIVALRHNYRFSASSGIGRLSRAVNAGDPASVAAILRGPPDASVFWQPMPAPGEFEKRLADLFLQGYREYLTAEDPPKALQALGRFTVLTPFNRGPHGVAALNRLAESSLARCGLIDPSTRWYARRPLLITRNDHEMGLFNGDLGVVLPAGGHTGRQEAWFSGPDGAVRRLPPQRLPPHETVFAMTVHKSQGSEFGSILVILPENDSPLLTRELLYTAVTRAREKVLIWGSEGGLTAAVSKKIERASGLQAALWPESPKIKTVCESSHESPLPASKEIFPDEPTH